LYWEIKNYDNDNDNGKDKEVKGIKKPRRAKPATPPDFVLTVKGELGQKGIDETKTWAELFN
jgi:hypothetical protein